MNDQTNSEARPDVCQHGGLRRQCETCDLADRLEQADAHLYRLGAELAHVRRDLMVAEAQVSALRAGVTALEQKWRRYRSQGTRWFNAPTTEEIANNARQVAAEDALMRLWLVDLAALLAEEPRSHE